MEYGSDVNVIGLVKLDIDVEAAVDAMRIWLTAAFDRNILEWYSWTSWLMSVHLHCGWSVYSNDLAWMV